MMPSPEALKQILPARLSEKRCFHSLKVAEEMAFLTSFFPLEEEERRGLLCAALLHDITKEEPREAQLARLKAFGYPLTQADLQSDETLHALSGYVCVKEEFSLPQVYAHAVLYHCTGGEKPSLSDALLFVADYTEESRRHESCQRVRSQLHSALENAKTAEERLAILEEAVYTICSCTLDYLKEKGRFVHPNTLLMQNQHISQGKETSMTEKNQAILAKAKRIAEVLDSKKAKDIRILYVHDQTVIADYFVIAHGTSSTQVRALCDEVEYKMEEEGFPCSSIQGKDGTNWIVMDYDDILVHVFHSELRSYYNLEKLWADAEQIPFEGAPAPVINPQGE